VVTVTQSIQFEPVIGLEIHVQLATKTKMFCGCRLAFGEEPNTLTCPICLGHPGTLPVTNAEAVHFALMIGMALECEIAPRSIFHRKNYFYPDLPKGYQISQFDTPICGPGKLNGVRIHRAHLEEDAAKLIHVGSSGRIHGSDASVVDFNRGGTPLVEIVTEPDVRSGAQAREWLQLLRETLRQLGVSDVNMDEGSLRCDANVSIRPVGETELGTKTELKNMNSFRFLERGVDAEIARQIAIVQGGGVVTQETLHFDPATGSLTSLRSKEEAHDYRYFPEPDLVAIEPTPEMLERAAAALPELPAARADRLESEYQLPAATANLLAFKLDLANYFEATVRETKSATAKRVADWVTGEFLAKLDQDADPAQSLVTPSHLARMLDLLEAKAISGAAAKTVLDAMLLTGDQPSEIIEREGLGSIGSGDELEQLVDAAMTANAAAVEQLRDGNDKAIGALVGYVMKETKGRADGGEVTAVIRQKISAMTGQ